MKKIEDIEYSSCPLCNQPFHINLQHVNIYIFHNAQCHLYALLRQKYKDWDITNIESNQQVSIDNAKERLDIYLSSNEYLTDVKNKIIKEL